MLFEKVPTPCIGICSTTYGDEVCRGCRRYLHEVINWNRYSDSEKRLIWQRLDHLLEQVLPGSFRIDDALLLSERLAYYRIPHRPESSPWAQLQSLLKATAKQTPNLQEFGIVRLDHSPLSLSALRERLQADLHELAAAYYEKDFLRAARNAAAISLPNNAGE
jgi:predicted Fe-S protein YdhL (DUF1289 family)